MIKRYAIAVVAAGLLYLPGCSDNVPEPVTVQDAGKVEQQMGQSAEYKQGTTTPGRPDYAKQAGYPTGQSGQGGY